MGLDLKIVEVHAPEHDSSIGRSRDQPQMGFYCCMETYSLRSDRLLDGGLVGHARAYYSISKPFQNNVYGIRINSL
jgi:hypothetical protein